MSNRRRSREVVGPNYGLYLDTPPLMIPPQGMVDCLNVRVKHKRIVRDNLGWSKFPNSDTPLNLDGKPVMLIDRFLLRSGVSRTVMANTTDLFSFDDETGDLDYITPRYEAGTVDATESSTTITGNTTTFTDFVKPGDFIHIGASGETDPAADWYEIEEVDSNTQLTLTEPYTGATDTAISYTIRRTFSGGLEHRFSSETFSDAQAVEGSDGDRWYCVNRLDPVVGWDGQSDQAYIPDLGNVDTCLGLRRFSNILVFIAPTTSGENRQFSIRTSAIGQPENTITLDATELVVHDGNDPVQRAENIGDLIAIYSENSIVLAQFVGPPLMFVFRLASRGHGPISRGAVATFPDFHLFIGRDTQYLFDGSAAQPISMHVWRGLLRTMPPELYDQIYHTFDEHNGELVWSLPAPADPEDGPCSTAVVQHYLEDVGNAPSPHTRRTFPFTAAGYYVRPPDSQVRFSDLDVPWEEMNVRWTDRYFRSEVPIVLVGDADGNVFTLGGRSTADGDPLYSFARMGRMEVSALDWRAVIRRLYPIIEFLDGMTHEVIVRIYGADFADGPATLIHEQALSVGPPGTRFFTVPRKSTKYIEVEFATTQATQYWAILGYAVDAVRGAGR